MLELPESEILRRDLDKEIATRKVKDVDPSGPMVMFDGFSTRKAVTEKLVGRKIVGVRRQGLHLLVELDEDETMIVDLTTGITVRRHANKDAHDDRTVMVITFTQGGQMRLLGPSTAEGVVRIVATDSLAELLPVPVGFDPIDEPIPWTVFGQALRARGNQKLYQLLKDPTFVIGLGPIYIDEILHSALLRYNRTAGGLTIQEIRRLYRAIVETMHGAVKHRGTSIGDDPFVDVFGKTGGYADHLEVYGRLGMRSRNGRGQVQKARVEGKIHHYCEYQV